jgi:hypothetical protein
MTSAQPSSSTLSPISVRLTPSQFETLDHLRDHYHSQSPIFKRPTMSDVVRALILEARSRLISICAQCDGQTIPHPDPAMTNIRFCPACKESVGLEPSQ